MARKHYLISYDVADDKRRNRIFETMQDHGNHTQFSVFLCQLDSAELATLRGVLSGIVHDKQDQVLIVDLGPATHDLDNSIETIGRTFVPTPRANIV
ncbi:MAG: CRISPR-associated endonuclease Cas2 [Phycisphaeraceae bacterium]